MQISENQPFVPVILGGDIGAYSLAREFHEQYDVHSVVVPSVMTGITEHSRILLPRPFAQQDDPEAFAAFVLRLGREFGGSNGTKRPLLLLGAADQHIRFIATHAEELSEWFTIPYVGNVELDRATEKDAFYQLCRDLGVSYPATVVHDCSGSSVDAPALEAELAAEGVPFPAIVKPSDGVAWGTLEFPGKKKVHTVASLAELTDLADKASAAGYAGTLVIQDLIPGDDSGMHLATFFSDKAGRVRFVSCGRVIVEEHAPGALGNSAAIVAQPNDVAVAEGTRLLEELGWTGFSMFDMKLDPRDGAYKFFELNPRLGRNHFYVTAAGHNVTRFYVEEYLRGGLAGGNDLQVASERHLYNILPLRLLRRYVPGDMKNGVEELISSKRYSHPLYYKKETNPRRWLYILLSTVNHYRKFKRHHPAA
ncbi:carbamoyl-phosphate synthase [Arthrobacter sp. AQ5-05]|uniref:carboxylate--amine ligase n=1 Tax=Arthrobacter sp. AQ5-05 TaxID=2184581 RepID=UPI000DCED7AA|nr:carbamoyl-phosphate synthase [Arthrobacter sp. AQ5-05]RAX48105.1 carbamoyl-phosphate synthase [Arthrobacter sp. AQ5-05]